MLTPRKMTNQIYCFTWIMLIVIATGMAISPTLYIVEKLSITVSALTIWMLVMAKIYESHRENALRKMSEVQRKDYIIRELIEDYNVTRSEADAIIKKTNGAYALQGHLGQRALSFAKFKYSWECYMELTREIEKMREAGIDHIKMKYGLKGIEIYSYEDRTPFRSTVIKTFPKGCINKKEFKMFSQHDTAGRMNFINILKKRGIYNDSNS